MTQPASHPKPHTDTVKKGGTSDHWAPSNPHFSRLTETLSQHINKARIETDFAPDSVAYTDVEHTTAQVFLGAAPHTDLNFANRWFVMLVLQAAPNATLHTARKIKAPKGKALESDQDVPMRQGEIFVFDAHRLHWVKPAVDVGPPTAAWADESHKLWEKHFHQTTVIIGTELPTRPTRDMAEQKLLEFFSQYTPECWQRATGLDSMIRPGFEPPKIKIKL